MMRDVLDRLREADPAAGVAVGPGDAEEVLRRGAHDVTAFEDQAPRPVRRRGALLAAAGVTAVLLSAGVGVAVLRGGGAPTLAPPVTVPSSGAAAHCLARLADGLQPAPYDGGGGAYEYLGFDSSSGVATEMPGGGFARATYRVLVRTWTGADGSGLVDTTRGEVTYADEASKAFYGSHERMLPPARKAVPFGVGERSLPALPAADPAAMAEALYQPRENGPSQALVGVADLNRARVLDAPRRAAILRFLAATDGVACGGEETTADGRTGVRVTAPRGKGPQPTPGDQGAETLLFDTRTGELLASGAGPEGETRYLERGYRDALSS